MSEASANDRRDVRMKGFAGRTPVTEVVDWIDQHLHALPAESAALQECAGRVLAGSVTSAIDVPGFDRAMMDGLALRAADIAAATADHEVRLRVLGDVLPGAPFPGTVEQGEAVRIMTGAPLPAGTDAVLPAELARIEATDAWARQPVPVGKHVGRRGEDIAQGSCLLNTGRRLRPQDLGLLSSIGVARVPVVRKPRVNLWITGNELVAAGDAHGPYSVMDANGPMLETLVQRDGGFVRARRLLRDDPELLLAALREEADLVIVSGGSSVGLEDHGPSLLARHGQLRFHGIALRPSGPTGLGSLEGRSVFLLPGNPVASLCAYDFFAGRAIRRLAGLGTDWPYPRVTLPLAHDLPSIPGRVDYARVRLREGQVEPIAISGASRLRSTTDADGFVIIPAEIDGYRAGHSVGVLLYDDRG